MRNLTHDAACDYSRDDGSRSREYRARAYYAGAGAATSGSGSGTGAAGIFTPAAA